MTPTTRDQKLNPPKAPHRRELADKELRIEVSVTPVHIVETEDTHRPGLPLPAVKNQHPSWNMC